MHVLINSFNVTVIILIYPSYIRSDLTYGGAIVVGICPDRLLLEIGDSEAHNSWGLAVIHLPRAGSVLLLLFLLILVLCFLRILDNLRLFDRFCLLFNVGFIGLVWAVWLLQSLGALLFFIHYGAQVLYRDTGEVIINAVSAIVIMTVVLCKLLFCEARCWELAPTTGC